jgi:NADPH-dependent curcumin reductase CurA
MGGRTEVDLTQLRTVADHVMQAADVIAEMRWPGLDPDDLEGSSVGRVPATELVAAQLTNVVANMRGWAVAAHMSADALERVDRRNGDNFHR